MFFLALTKLFLCKDFSLITLWNWNLSTYLGVQFHFPQEPVRSNTSMVGSWHFHQACHQAGVISHFEMRTSNVNIWPWKKHIQEPCQNGPPNTYIFRSQRMALSSRLIVSPRLKQIPGNWPCAFIRPENGLLALSWALVPDWINFLVTG